MSVRVVVTCLLLSCLATLTITGGPSQAAVTDGGGYPPAQLVVPGLVVRKAPEPAPKPERTRPVRAPRQTVPRKRDVVRLPTALDLRFVQANIRRTLGAGDFVADLRRAAAGQPDFLTVNEGVRPAELFAQALPGYSIYRGPDSRWTLETTVMWRTDRWQAVGSGTRYLHARGGRWGTRAVNWVRLQDAVTGRTVSVVSAHASPDSPHTHGLLPVFMGRLSALVRELSASGPVFVGGDLNVHYTSGRFPRPAMSAAGLVPTYDAFGMPAGGTGDHGGATIDYLLYQPGAGVTATGQSKLELRSDHDAVAGTFHYAW